MLYLKDINRGERCEPLTQCQLCVCVHAVFVCHGPALHPLLFQIILPNDDMHVSYHVHLHAESTRSYFLRKLNSADFADS